MAAIVERHAVVGAVLLQSFQSRGVPLGYVVKMGKENFLKHCTGPLGCTKREGEEVWARFKVLAAEELDAKGRQETGEVAGQQLASRRLCADCGRKLYEFESDRCVACVEQRRASS